MGGGIPATCILGNCLDFKEQSPARSCFVSSLSTFQYMRSAYSSLVLWEVYNYIRSLLLPKLVLNLTLHTNFESCFLMSSYQNFQMKYINKDFKFGLVWWCRTNFCSVKSTNLLTNINHVLGRADKSDIFMLSN